MTFYVGQRVVMVGWGTNGDIINKWREIGANYPEVGEVYTVRAVKPWRDAAVLLLREVDNAHLGYSLEPGFRQEFFRPVVDRKSQVSTAAKQPVDA